MTTKERPVLFSGAMVRAILEGRKTQTRRVIKDDWFICLDPDDDEDRESAIEMCPYGKAGDRLWVRETWRLACVNAELLEARFWTVQFGDFAVVPHPQPAKELFAPIAAKDSFVTSPTGIEFGKWRPSIHMPRWASRITLEIVSVRVERLQDISGEDCVAEGVDALYEPDTNVPADHYNRQTFASLWDSINAKRGFGWNANPWVWVVEFKQVSP